VVQTLSTCNSLSSCQVVSWQILYRMNIPIKERVTQSCPWSYLNCLSTKTSHSRTHQCIFTSSSMPANLLRSASQVHISLLSCQRKQFHSQTNQSWYCLVNSISFRHLSFTAPTLMELPSSCYQTLSNHWHIQTRCLSTVNHQLICHQRKILLWPWPSDLKM